MSSPLQARVEAALADMRAQGEKLRAVQDQLTKTSTTVTSKDRMIEATVDPQGRLQKVKLRGERYRQLAPAEFAARLVETVQAAQVEAAQKAASLLKSMLPGGLKLGEVLDNGFDMDKMFDAAVEFTQESMWQIEAPTPEGRNRHV